MHATWNDLGRFAFAFGRESFSAENVRQIEGVQYFNCAGAIQCQNTGLLQTVQLLGDDAANTNGNVTLAINYTFVLTQPFDDPEDPNPPIYPT